MFGFRFGRQVTPVHVVETPIAPTAPLSAPPYYRPYADQRLDYLYNWSFTDDFRLWEAAKRNTAGTPIGALFDDQFDESAMRRIAEDAAVDSRYRLLAYRRLREQLCWTGEGVALGVVIEFPQAGGLDTLAAFATPAVTYLNQAKKCVLFEDKAERTCELGQNLVGLCQKLLDRTPIWTGPRQPPIAGVPNCRINILGSDGLHVVEGTERELEAEAATLAVMRLSGLIVNTIVQRVREDNQVTRH